MDADARLAQRIEFERVRSRPVAEAGKGRPHLDRRAEHAAFAGRAVALRVADDGPGPRQLGAEHARGNRIDDAVFRPLDDFSGYVLVFQADGEIGEGLCGRGHFASLSSVRMRLYSV